MNKRPFFSIIVPCYNDGSYAPGQYIDRILSNMLKQGLDRDQLEVIISDNCSLLPYDGTIGRYKDSLNIKQVKTISKSCLGKVRQEGLKVAEGEWVCFIDHTDLLHDFSLSIVKTVIENTGERYLVYSDIDKVSFDDTNKAIEEITGNETIPWTYGKFYNLDNLWLPFKIQSFDNMKLYPDLALARSVEFAMFKLDRTPTYIKKSLYKWVYNPKFLRSRDISSVKIGRIKYDYNEVNFADYIEAEVGTIFESYAFGTLSRDDAIMFVIRTFVLLYRSICEFRKKHTRSYLKGPEAQVARMLNRAENILNINLPAIKILCANDETLCKLVAAVNDFANSVNQKNVVDWLSYIHDIDYSTVIDSEQSKLIKQGSGRPLDEADITAHRPFFSLVIACYNDGRYGDNNYLDRLLASVTRQNIPRGDLEVILSDDCSPVPFDSIVAKYSSLLDIKRVKTDYNFAPGNTRAKGVEIASGQWLCFADHDDIFYDGALSKVKKGLLEKEEKYYAFGLFYGIDGETGKVKTKYEKMMNWCHAKFYNLDNLWKPFNIHFIKDLKSHEDIAICTQVSCALQTVGSKGWTYFPFPVYAWTDNPQSVSHAKYTVDTETGPREFLEVFFDDYVHATGYIYLEQFNAGKIKMPYAIKSVLEIMCYCYFYTQGFQFRRPDDFYKQNLVSAGEFVRKCKDRFNMTNESMYNAIASNNAALYYNIRRLADPGSGKYIATQTLREWFDLVCNSH